MMIVKMPCAKHKSYSPSCPNCNPIETCPCGRPLHYGSSDSRAIAEKLIEEKGRLVVITTPEGSWNVPRHYVMLHGLKADELPTLAIMLGFEGIIE